MNSHKDNDLIKSILRDDKSALGKLYHRHKSYWFRICLRYASEHLEAEDLFQEAVSKVFKELKKYDSNKGSFAAWSNKGSFAAWSNKVLVHEIIKSLKKYQWLDAFSAEETNLKQLSWNGGIMDQITTKELMQLIQKLPLGYRLIFNMYELEGYKHKEIAQILDISIGTSKSQLSRAKKLLQKRIQILF